MNNFITKALKKFGKLSAEQTYEVLQTAEQELNILQMVLDSVTTGFIVCNNDNLLLLTNKNAKRFINLAEGSELKDCVWQSVGDPDIALFLKQTLTQSERVQEREFFVESNGIKRLLSISVLPLVQKGKVTGSIVMIEDISEKRSREIEFRRAENLASLTNVAATVAHEIKNPLASISIYIQLTQKLVDKVFNISIAEKDHEKFDKYLGNINEEIERLNKIVVDFLFAVRPLEFNLIRSNINDQIKDAIEFTAVELEDHNIKYTIELQDTIPFILLDRTFFKQVLLNLIKNAIEAMPDGGELIIRTFQKDTDIKITIRDTGCGISEELKAKIFEPYWTTKIKGTGLGLTMVFKVVKELKGDVLVQSELGKGTMFEITLPVLQKEKSLPSPGGTKDAEHNKEYVERK
ncbi:MAG: ATP-binding protein [Termitinemataceae bacterium]|nr:MAG: ATP-binding protein [Termitinemataceae bacterium]